jgi:hypothetical protein
VEKARGGVKYELCCVNASNASGGEKPNGRMLLGNDVEVAAWRTFGAFEYLTLTCAAVSFISGADCTEFLADDLLFELGLDLEIDVSSLSLCVVIGCFARYSWLMWVLEYLQIAYC